MEQELREEGRLPGEVVIVYRRPQPREVVEQYARPLPARMIPKKEPKKRRKRRGLVIFLLCLGVAAALALGLWFWPEEEATAPKPAAPAAPVEISIPTYPVGQGVAFDMETEKAQPLTIQEVYRQVNPSVVTVMVRLDEGKDYTRTSVGTGVIFTEDGYIITNHHVVEEGLECMVGLTSGYSLPAKYVASDEENDLAVLKAEDDLGVLNGQGFPTARFVDSDSLVVGDTVYAIGNPLGVELRGTLTDGIVSAINRDVQVDERTMTLIQTNAALNSGNSGGPLINDCGQVVGINVVKMMSDYENIEGLGFAIPTASMERIVNDLLRFGQVQPEPTLGMMVLQVGTELEEGLVGILVQEVTKDSVADRAGVKVGDYVIEADGQSITTSQELLKIRRRHYLGEKMELVIWREGERMELTLELNESSDS